MSPDLFSAVADKGVSISECEEWGFSGWKRNIEYEESLNNDALLNDVAELLEIMQGCSPSPSIVDRVVWPFEASNSFTTKSCYVKLAQGRSAAAILPGCLRKALEFVWKFKVPHKIQRFGWRLLLERIPTRDLLQKRDIIADPDNCKCVFCNLEVEEGNHLFIHCSVANAIWRSIFFWLDLKEIDLVVNVRDTCYSFFLKFYKALLHKASCSQKDVI